MDGAIPRLFPRHQPSFPLARSIIVFNIVYNNRGSNRPDRLDGTPVKGEEGRKRMWDFFGTDGGRSGWTAYAILWLRIAFGVHSLVSGLNYFFPLVPPAAIHLSPAAPFVAALDDVGLFFWIKLVEVAVGVLLLNLYVPLALVMEMPTTLSIFYLNTFVDAMPRQLYTGPKELFLNLILIAAYSAYFLPLLAAKAEYTPIWRKARNAAGRNPVSGAAQAESDA